MSFDAFISYSHSSDGELAPDVQRGLEQLAKPWSRRQALSIFRDDTGLSVSPALWASITAAMDDSRFFVLMASPAAAQSEWVNREIAHWMANQPDGAARILPVVTEGTWVWDEATEDLDFTASSAAPAALSGVFTEEPRHLDLSWARGVAGIGLDDPRFRDAVADLAAPIHGIPKDELEGEAIRQHRRSVRIRRAAIAALTLLVIGLTFAGCQAVQSAREARSALRDLEDANGNIVDLEAQGEQLEAANAQAAADLADTEAARIEADALAATAQRQAAEAAAAREEAEAARSEAEVSRAQAEAAQELADRERVQAEAARDEAAVARDQAVAAASEAQAAAAEAEANEAVARRAEADAKVAEQTARAAEDAARIAEEAAQQNEEAARAAESQARADEAAAQAAENEAQLQEQQAREAQTAAEASAQTARAAETAALAAEEAAARARDVAETEAAQARTAEAVARQQEAEAQQAASAAAEAQAAAEALRDSAEAAAFASTLAQASAEATNPDLGALLATESYCAVAGCGGPDALRSTLSAASSVERLAEPDDRLDPLLPLIDGLVRNRDVIGTMPGWSGRAVDVAVSDDGTVVAALRDDGTIRLWGPSDPAGSDLESVTDVIGVDVSGDGSTLAYVKAVPFQNRFGFPEGALETLTRVDISGSQLDQTRFLRFIPGGTETPNSSASVELHPSDDDFAIVRYADPVRVLVSVPLTETTPQPPAGGPPLPIVELSGTAASWLDSDRILVVGEGVGEIVDVDGASLEAFPNPIAGPSAPTPTAVEVVGSQIAVGYDDGSVAVPGLQRVWRRLAAGSVNSLGFGPELRHIVVGSEDGTAVRVRTSSSIGRGEPLKVPGVASARSTALAAAQDQNLMVLAAGTNLVGVSISPAAPGGAIVEDVSLAPSAGGTIRTTDSGAQIVRAGTITRLPNVSEPRALSADGSTLVFGDLCSPRVVRTDGTSVAVPLALPAFQCLLAGTESGFRGGEVAVAVSPDGSMVVAGVRCGYRRPGCPSTAPTEEIIQLLRFDAVTGALLADTVIDTYDITFGSATISKILVSDDHIAIRLWTASFGTGVSASEQLQVFDRSGNRLLDVQRRTPPPFSDAQVFAGALVDGPDAAFFVATNDGAVERFDLGANTEDTRQGTEVLDSGAADDILSLAAVEGGSDLLVLGFESGRVEVWRSSNGRFVAQLTPHDHPVASVVALTTGDGLVVASGTIGRSGIVRTIDDPDVLRSALCDIAARDLTTAEWIAVGGTGDPPPCRRGID